MLDPLHAPRGTKLDRRIVKEGRLVLEASGGNRGFSTNFVPKMGYETLIKSYRQLIGSIYSPRPYNERVKVFLRRYRLLLVEVDQGAVRVAANYPGGQV